MNIKGMHHVGIYVSDEHASLEFYRDKLGATVIRSFEIAPGKSNWIIDLGGGAVLELIPVATGESASTRGWAHIALEVDNAEAMYLKMLAAGATPWVAPTTEMDVGFPARLAFVQGPDGELIELIEQL